MPKQTCLLIAAAAAMLAVQPGNLVAGVTVFDNYGPGWSYTYNMGKNVSGNGSSTGECHTAAGFVSTAGGKVTDVWLTVGLNYGPNILKVALLDSYNYMPAAELAAWTVQDAMQPFGQTGQTPLHWLLADGPTLVQGNTYWIACSPGDDYMAAGWYFNAIVERGDTTQRKHVTDAWKPLSYGSDHPAFRVDVTPEPATLALLALGGMGLLARRRQK